MLSSNAKAPSFAIFPFNTWFIRSKATSFLLPSNALHQRRIKSSCSGWDLQATFSFALSILVTTGPQNPALSIMMNTSGDHAAKGMSAPHIDMYIVRVIEMPIHLLKMIYQHSYSNKYATKSEIHNWLILINKLILLPQMPLTVCSTLVHPELSMHHVNAWARQKNDYSLFCYLDRRSTPRVDIFWICPKL